MLAGQTAATRAHYRNLQRLEASALTAARRAWLAVDIDNLSGSWPRMVESLAPNLVGTKTLAATEGGRYIAATLGARVLLEGQVNATRLATQAADGRSLVTLLDSPRIAVANTLAKGWGRDRALRVGLHSLERITLTEVADAMRLAEGIGITTATPTAGFRTDSVIHLADPRVREWTVAQRRRYFGDDYTRWVNSRTFGWVRTLNPGACDRCVILANQWFGWNDGFQRHPQCLCTHIPVEDIDGPASATDPDEYFASLSEEEQNATFGRDNAEAIRDGASVIDVVNAGRQPDGKTYWRGMGTTAQGRMTPEAIYRTASGDRMRAIELLHEHGYLTRGAFAAAA